MKIFQLWDFEILQFFRYDNKNAENQPPKETGTGVPTPIFDDRRLKIGM